LWGSGVSFERDWLRTRAPAVLSLLKHRNGDVNTLYGLQGIVMEGDPNASKAQPADRTHRSLEDLEKDIAIAKEWAGLLPLLAALQAQVEEGPRGLR
jgi:oligoribonuclease (3'-5' exoribonuclease)